MKEIIFILPTYPEVMYSFLIAFSKVNRINIKIVCLKKLLEERRKIYANDEEVKHIQFLFKEDIEDFYAFIDEFISKNIDEIFIFGGLLGEIGNILQLYNRKGGKKAFIITEKPSIRPSRYCKWIIRVLKTLKTKLLYGNAYRRVKGSIRAIMVTGEKGVKQLQSIGIPKEKLYNFMYTHIEENVIPKPPQKNDIIRFVYVGRFDFLNRGIDSLMYTFDKLQYQNWMLDLVGGYGENAKEVVAWANRKEKVSYIGSWPSNQVINNLQNYDVCISPTRIDGWRIQVNQAIMAGIATITTEEAISDELIKVSNCGLVVDAFKKDELYRAVSFVLANPAIIDEWKENTKKYKNRISNERVAEYVKDIIEYALLENDKQKPRCPWL